MWSNSTNFFAIDRISRIERVISLLVATDDPNDFETQCIVYEAVGIDSNSFSRDEIAYIENEISKRWYR